MRASRIALSAVAAFAALLAPTAATAAVAAPAPNTYSYDFAQSAQGWVGGFADYSPETSAGILELKAGLAKLPTGTANTNAYYVQGHNRSDDLFMFLKKRLGPADGIVANKSYTVKSSVTFWSEAATGCFGIGGSPGASLFLKAGASPREPVVKLDPTDGHYRAALDHGYQSNSGQESTVLGNIENGQSCQNPPNWTKVTRTSPATNPIVVKADARGYLWLNVGTDSGYEGLTRLYYSNVTTTLTPR